MSRGVSEQTQWRGQRDARRRRFWLLIGVSVLLHTPLTPLAALAGLLTLIGSPPQTEFVEPKLDAIPVSLLSSDELEQLGAEPEDQPAAAPEKSEEDGAEPTPEPAAVEPVAAPEPPKREPKPPEKPVADAGAPDGGDREGDGGAGRDAEVPAPVASLVEGGAQGEQPKPAAASDPGALAGAASSVTDPNANVKLLIFNERIRKHPAGPRIGKVLTYLPQWRSFFGPTTLDPVRDFGRIYVAGPQFRVSNEIVAVIEYSVKPKEIREAIDSIVRRPPKGRWLDTPLPAARGRADRAERTFVMAKDGILVMVPPQLTDDAIDKAPSLTFPNVKGNAAVVAFINTPWRALIGMPGHFKFPESIRSAMLKAVPRDDGGVDLEVQAIDESAEFAKSNAALLERAINLLTQRQMQGLSAVLFGSKLSIIEPVELHAQGNKIVGGARVTARQLDRILNYAEAWLMPSQPVPQPTVAPNGPRRGATGQATLPHGATRREGAPPRPAPRTVTPPTSRGSDPAGPPAVPSSN